MESVAEYKPFLESWRGQRPNLAGRGGAQLPS